MELIPNQKYKITIKSDKIKNHPFLYQREVTYLGKDYTNKEGKCHIFFSDMDMFLAVNYENSTWTSRENLVAYQYLQSVAKPRMIKINNWHLHILEDHFTIDT
jgi:hypothetical protein